ncbi:ParB-like nuclease domain protein [compost metagenome]
MKRLIKKQNSLNKISSWIGTPRLYLDEGPNAEYEADSSTTTCLQQGEIDLSDILDLPGRNGEVRKWEEWTNPKDGVTYNFFGKYREERWNEFLEDIKQNGITSPIQIRVEKDGTTTISEGNHRREAAIQLGLTSVPVEIQYMGNSQRQVSRFGLGEGNYTVLKRGWQN